MAAPCRREVRILVVEAGNKGCTIDEIVEMYDVSESSVKRWRKRFRETGSVDALPMGGDRRSHHAEQHAEAILLRIEEIPDPALDEITAWLAEELNHFVSRSAVWRLLERHDWSWKRKTVHASERESDDVQALRKAWEEARKEMPAGRVICFDETAVRRNMARRNGRSPRGGRRPASIPFGGRETITLVAAMSQNGIIAPMILEGSLNGDTCLAWVSQFLVRELKKGDIVICDNLPAHKVAGIGEAIEPTGAKLVCLPPYSPDLNPIEMAFSQIKSFLKKTAARSPEELYDAITQALDIAASENARNYYSVSGYCGGST